MWPEWIQYRTMSPQSSVEAWLGTGESGEFCTIIATFRSSILLDIRDMKQITKFIKVIVYVILNQVEPRSSQFILALSCWMIITLLLAIFGNISFLD